MVQQNPTPIEDSVSSEAKVGNPPEAYPPLEGRQALKPRIKTMPLNIRKKPLHCHTILIILIDIITMVEEVPL